MKICTACKKVKKLSEFSMNKRNKTDGRQPKCKTCNSAYYKKNKQKIQDRVRKNYYSNHEEKLERRRELAKRPEAKKKKSQQDRNYYFKNKAKISEYYKDWAKANRDYLRKYWKKWYWDNHEHNKMYGRISTHRKKEVIRKNGNNTLTLEQAEELLESHPFCAYCKESDCKLTLDHIIPISRGGQNCIDNINIACLSCNLSKSNKLLSEWKGPVRKRNIS